MSPDHARDDAPLPTDQAGQVGAQYERSAQFIARMVDEGGSPEAAAQAAAAHFEFEEKRMPPGKLLPGWTAQRWQATNFFTLGCFLAVLISVLFTAPAFHPTESATQGRLWGILFLATFLPIVLLMVGSGVAVRAKAGKELRNGYTTLRWLSENTTEVRDARGMTIPPGDRRLTSSAKYMRAFILIGSACAVLSPAIWMLRLVIR
jgi:hypothetical protein